MKILYLKLLLYLDMAVANGKLISGKEIFKLFGDFNASSLTYVYKGIFNASLTDKILALAETNMNISEEISKVQKRVYFVMVESLQNITRHQDEHQSEENHAFFIVHNTDGEYNLTSCNIIEDDKILELKCGLDKINSLNSDELKDYYKHVLENTGMSDKGGAGLGLIEMARKSGNKLKYDFEHCENNNSLFYFKARVSGTPEGKQCSDDLSKEKSLHQLAREHGISMVYQGVFTQENLRNLITMTEGSVSKNESIGYKKKVFSIMVEMLQNICNHSSRPDEKLAGNPGIIVVSTKDEGSYLYSGNYIENENIEVLSDKINRVNNSTTEELEELYNETILLDHTPEQKGAGLGFIDIKMKSGSDIQYTVEPFNENYSFFTLTSFIPAAV
jgi:hypothetical protein